MTSSTKRIVLPILIIVVAVGIFAALMAAKAPPEKKSEERETPFVSVETIQLAPLTLKVQSQGLVQPKYDTQILAQVSGEITFIASSFVRGGLVKKGDLLAQIDPFNYQVKLQQANANLASAKANFILERAQGQVAEAEWQKITTAEPSELGLRKPQQEQALAAVKAAEAGVKQATKDLQRTKIIAPFDALIGTRNVSPGSFVNMGTPIGQVLDIDTAEVRLPVAGDDLLFLEAAGRNAAVTLTAFISGKPFSWQATIVRDEGVVDSSSRMVYLVAQLNDPYLQTGAEHAYRLPFGTFVTAEIEGRILPSAAYVPRQLLGSQGIPLLVDKKLHFRPVEVVRHEGKLSVISSGLNDGDLYITSSLEYPIEGMPLDAASNPATATSDADSVEAPPITTAEPSSDSFSSDSES